MTVSDPEDMCEDETTLDKPVAPEDCIIVDFGLPENILEAILETTRDEWTLLGFEITDIVDLERILRRLELARNETLFEDATLATCPRAEESRSGDVAPLDLEIMADMIDETGTLVSLEANAEDDRDFITALNINTYQ